MHALTPGSFLKRLRRVRSNRDQVNDKKNRGKASRERGAATVIFALMVPVLFGALAMGVDVGKLVYERQHLSNALDAAALAGAAYLPGDPVAARNAAASFARANDPAAVPAVKFWCVVASTGAARTVVSSQIPSVCNPGTISGARCSETICAIPCIPGTGIACNSITVTDDKDVAFNFAPVIGIDSGNTGSLASDACKGSCGSQIPNPMDIALVADRTGSMSATDLASMKTALQTTLKTMTKDQQYVALGTIGPSSPTAGCITNPSGSATSGTWIPVPFSNDYTTAGTPPALNNSSPLVKGVQCLPSSGSRHLPRLTDEGRGSVSAWHWTPTTWGVCRHVQEHPVRPLSWRRMVNRTRPARGDPPP